MVWRDPCGLASSGYTSFTPGGPWSYNNMTFVIYGESGTPSVPLGNWALYAGLFLMVSFVIYRFRRNIF